MRFHWSTTCRHCSRLYACTCGQVVLYARNYPKDRLHLKVLVVSVGLIDTARTVMDILVVYRYLIFSSHHSCAERLKLLYNYLLRNRWRQAPLTIIALMIAAASFAGGTSSCSTSSPIDTNKHRHTACSGNCVWNVAGHVYPELPFKHYPQRQYKLTGYSRTENIIHKLTLYVVNRGILTSLFQLLHLATYMTTRRKSSLIFMPGSKIYVNSLLAVLNARHVVMTTGGLTVPSDFMTSKDPHATSSSTLAPMSFATRTEISITKKTILDDGVFDTDTKNRSLRSSVSSQ
ncbi:hypothetical protein AcV7_004737 [Taiwanofungus camphoratus]|nr:hypothetical protein AcV7_004737 [Antrodia cinnamomea]